jgi:hypothetical protein
VVRLRQASVDLDLLPELVSNCRPYNDILPGFPNDDPNVMEGIKHFADTMGYTSTTGIVLWSTLGLPLRIFLGFLSVVGVCAVLYGLYWLASNSPKTLAFFFSLGFWIGITYCLAQLDQKRNLLGSVLGEEYGDSQWGFGQVLAVFAWMPLLLETVVGILESVARACTSSSDRKLGSSPNPLCPS